MNRTHGFPTSVAALAAATALALSACGPAGDAPLVTAGEKDHGDAIQALVTNNGMSMNGMSMNGMSMNGLSTNGLTVTGLSKTSFSTWFNLSPVLNDIVMRYVVRCALASGKSLSWKNPVTGVKYSWPGTVGVAPGWTSGSPISVPEQQLVSACLAAHANKFLLQIPIAIEGRAADGKPLPISPRELATYDVRESCFFGDLFTGEGIFAGIDHADWGSRWSSLRACAFDYASIGTDRDCPPIRVVGVCSEICAPAEDGVSYDSCSYGGKTYKALATRIAPSSRSYCGDGRCDPQEQCGTGVSWDGCGVDCGHCP